jgi:hypothetical protein
VFATPRQVYRPDNSDLPANDQCKIAAIAPQIDRYFKISDHEIRNSPGLPVWSARFNIPGRACTIIQVAISKVFWGS